jgi:uncharacterized membrane protein
VTGSQANITSNEQGAIILKHQLGQPVILVAGAIAILIAIGALLHAPIDRQLHAWKLLPEPERLTELYFTQPNRLPTTYTPGQTQTVSFTVHNLEYRTTDYRYRIIETGQTTHQTQTLASGSFTLSQSAYERPTVRIIIADLGPRAKVGVVLINVNESIDYLLTRSGA